MGVQTQLAPAAARAGPALVPRPHAGRRDARGATTTPLRERLVQTRDWAPRRRDAYDTAVVGGGILGRAVARELTSASPTARSWCSSASRAWRRTK